jgi:hypothetical protein
LVIASCWFVVARLTGGWLPRVPTFLSVLFVGFVVTQYVPAILFFDNPQLPHAISVQFMGLVVASAVAMTLGAVVGSAVTRLTPTEVRASYQAFASSRMTADDARFVTGYGLIATVFVAIYVMVAPVWPLLGLLTGTRSTTQVNGDRSRILGPGLHIPIWPLFDYARSILIPILFLLSLFMFRASPKGSRKRVLAVAFVGVALLFNSYAASKTSVVELFAIVALAALIYAKGPSQTPAARARRRRWTRRVVASCALLIVAYPAFIYSQKAFGVNRPVGSIVQQGEINRVIGTPAYLSYGQLQLFPDLFPYTHFRDIQLLSKVLGRPYVDLSKLTAVNIRHDSLSQAPPAAIGSFWAEGGRNVVWVGFFVIGFGVQLLQAWCARRLPRDPLSIAFVAALCWVVFRLNMTNAHGVLLSEGVVPVLVVAWIWKRQLSGAARRRAIPNRLRAVVHRSHDPAPLPVATANGMAGGDGPWSQDVDAARPRAPTAR